MKRSILLLPPLLLLSCVRIEKKEEAPPPFPFEGMDEIECLGHRGGRPPGRAWHAGYGGNGLLSARHGLRDLDGIELDLQIGSDSVLWVQHDHRIRVSSGKVANIADLDSASIATAIEEGHARSTLLPFRNLVQRLSEEEASTKKILSLDLKALQNPRAIERYGGSIPLSECIIQRTSFLKEQQGFRFLAEIPRTEQLDPFSAFPGERFLLCKSPPCCSKKAEKLDAVGVSSSLEHAQHCRAEQDPSWSESPLQLWTPNTGRELAEALEHGPDLIQTDRPPLVRTARMLDTSEARYERLLREKGRRIESEFEELATWKMEKLEPPAFIDLRLRSERSFHRDSLLLVLSKEGEGEADVRYWRSFRFKKGERRHPVLIHPTMPAANSRTMFKLYCWKRKAERVLEMPSVEAGLWK